MVHSSHHVRRSSIAGVLSPKIGLRINLIPEFSSCKMAAISTNKCTLELIKGAFYGAANCCSSVDQAWRSCGALPEDNADPAPVGNNANEIRTTESNSQLLQWKLKQQKREVASEQPDVYLNLDMHPGTSVNCERLFSNAKFILSDTRKRRTPSLFETLLLLKENRNYWNVYLVGKAMGQTIQGVDNEGVANDKDLDWGLCILLILLYSPSSSTLQLE